MARLQNDAAYAALHKSAMDTLQLYETAAERALEDAIARGDQAEIDAIRRYQVETLGDARHRLTDEDDPLSKDELREMQRDMHERMPEAVARHLKLEPTTADSTPSGSQALSLPPLGN